jgi:hypothetical protein
VSAAPIKVTRMSDGGGYVVARTEDVDAAREAAREWERSPDGRAGDGYDAEELAAVVDRIDRLTPRVGWYRWTPCNENSCYDGGGHSGHLGFAAAPARGVFRGVYLDDPS